MSEADDAMFWAGWTAVADERRKIIVQHLADISEENFIVDFEPIFVKAIHDAYAPVRVAALDGVWDSSNVKLVRPIIALLQTDADPAVQAASASALAHYVLLAEWGQFAAHVSAPIVEALLAEYEKPDTAIAVKRSALEALGAANHPRVKSLIEEAYESPRLDIQLSAVFAMGNSADSRWLPTIMGEMENPAAEMRAEAARAAGIIGGSDAVDALANLLADEDMAVTVAAVEALGQIGSDRASEILGSLLEDSDFEDIHDTIEDVLEEMVLLSGGLDFDEWFNEDE
jgi:HEAT repeat protein